MFLLLFPPRTNLYALHTNVTQKVSQIHPHITVPLLPISLASLVPSIMMMISHLFSVSVLYCGRCQYGLLDTFSMVDPHAPKFVTAYFPGYASSSIIWSCPGYVWFPPVECTPAVIESPTVPILICSAVPLFVTHINGVWISSIEVERTQTTTTTTNVYQIWAENNNRNLSRQTEARTWINYHEFYSTYFCEQTSSWAATSTGDPVWMLGFLQSGNPGTPKTGFTYFRVNNHMQHITLYCCSALEHKLHWNTIESENCDRWSNKNDEPAIHRAHMLPPPEHWSIIQQPW